MTQLRKDIEDSINRNSAESGSNTPDFILAEYLMSCLSAYDIAVTSRDGWNASVAVVDDTEDGDLNR